MDKDCTSCAKFDCDAQAICDGYTPMEKLNVVNLKLYSEDVARTAPRNDMTLYEFLGWAALGIGAEAGELQNVIKKTIHQGHNLNIEEIKEELGDLFFYMTALMDNCSINLLDVIAVNIDKRRQRYPDGFKPEHSINRLKRGLSK